MARFPRLVILSAPSGAGKTTLGEMLLNEFPALKQSVSTTTRPKRPHEEDGTHYHFLAEKEFDAMVKRGEFAEWATVHGHRYGTSKRVIEQGLTAGKHLLFLIDVQGAMHLKQAYPEHVVLIFILPPSMKALEQRLVKRKGDSPSAIETRLQNAYNEVEWSKRFDHRVLNENLDEAYQQLRTIIKQECQI